jgi:hypothetical protein
MEFNAPHIDDETQKKLDLARVFGEGVQKLIDQIAHDNSALTDSDVIAYAWSLIPDVTAYGGTEQKDLIESAITLHEVYEGFRRIKD